LIRADVAHDKLVAMGFDGSERTTRRAVAAAKQTWRSGHRRCFGRGCLSGLWLQLAWGVGSTIGGDGSRCCAAPGWLGPGVEAVRYSVPHKHIDERVWVRWCGEEFVVTVVNDGGPVEIARHARGSAGDHRFARSIAPCHPGRRALPGDRTPRGQPGRGGVSGYRRPRGRLAARGCRGRCVSCAPRQMRTPGRDLDSSAAGCAAPPIWVTEVDSLQPGTAGWAGFGATNPGGPHLPRLRDGR
jgi:hypothetical protein